jgi:uncharacterized protein YeaO (DUF488 family)
MREAPPPGLKIKRVYRAQRQSDGKRVLVDALWPRGLSRERMRLDFWMKEIAPSAELRRWFGHDPERWSEFRRRYSEELAQHPDEIERLRDMAANEMVTLLYAAKDEAHNNAVVLKEIIEAGRSRSTDHVTDDTGSSLTMEANNGHRL